MKLTDTWHPLADLGGRDSQDVSDALNRLPSPFRDTPHPVAALAARALMAQLERVRGASPWSSLLEPGGGKMFGVLVVRSPSGELGFIKSFSGMMFGGWHVTGFAPPIFSVEKRSMFEPAGARKIGVLTAVVAERQKQLDEVLRQLNAWRQKSPARRQGPRQAWPEQASGSHHAAPSNERASQAGPFSDKRGPPDRQRAHAERVLKRARAREREALGQAIKRCRLRLRAAKRLRAYRSRRLMDRIFETYEVRTAAGEAGYIPPLFAPHEPPSGVGDCAAPKLFARAFAQGLKPVALAEFWWGAPPPGGGRREGAFYGACVAKCRPLLGFMLQGLNVEPAPPFEPGPVMGAWRVRYEDGALVVVEKPAGLLCVPGRGATNQECLQSRVAALLGQPGEEIRVAHRLDLDTSGLVIAARTRDALVGLHKQFSRGLVEKLYVADVSEPLLQGEGDIRLPLCGDPLDRPRQIVDRVRGKSAHTHWRVCARQGAHTRLELVPVTGRTHQLRVHCAHQDGLDAPLVGDRLYGQAADRLHLHASRVAFAHPLSGRKMVFESEVPFGLGVTPSNGGATR